MKVPYKLAALLIVALFFNAAECAASCAFTINVGFDTKSIYTRAKLPTQKAEVKVGDRIVIHAVELNEKLVAHTVELGGATTAAKTK